MRRHPRAARRRIEEFQSRRLRRLVTHAWENVPFYRQRFDQAGIHPHDIRTVADLERLPVTRKTDMLAANLSDLIANGLDMSTLMERRTSGMTGEPFRIWRSKREELLSSILIAREMRMLGVTPDDVVAQIRLLGVAIDQPSPAAGERIVTSLARTLFRRRSVQRRVRVNAGLPADDLIAEIKSVHPSIVAGYAGVLAHLARRLELTADQTLRPRLVISGAEVLTPQMREQISRSFGSPIYDTYGCHEMGRMATECAEGGEMHICDDSVIVEMENAGVRAGEGESGNVIATSLHSWAMPFIRYELGDVAVRGRATCGCGLPFSTLKKISGRKYDYFHAADGSRISPHLILDSVQTDAIGWVLRYQFIQEASGRVVMPIVPRVPPTESQLADLEARMRVALGPGIEFEHRLVDALEFEPGGKTRRFKSELESEYD